MTNGILMPNFLVLALVALIPLIVGSIWYNPKVFGDPPRTEEERKKMNMPLILILAYVFSFFLALGLNFVVIHQFHLYSILAHQPGINEKGTTINNFYNDFMSKYGNQYRTYKHGAFHAFLASITFALPLVGIKALFDGKGFKYIAVNVGYWMVCFVVMGAIICHWDLRYSDDQI